MGDYYNKTRAPIGVTLRRGGSMSIGPKSWCYIPPEDEGTPGLAESVRKGFLVRALVPITDTSPAVVVATAAPVAATPSATLVPKSAISSVSAPEPIPTTPPVVEQKQFRRSK